MGVCLGKENYSPNEAKPKGNRRLEWKNAQVLLNQMGIQLIHDTKNTKKEGAINNVSRKKGYRELQNLKFHVNYEGSSCSRCFLTSP